MSNYRFKTVEDFEDHLGYSGWLAEGLMRDNKVVATVWHHRVHPEAEVVVPKAKGFRDYNKRLREALVELAECEGEDASSIEESYLSIIDGQTPRKGCCWSLDGDEGGVFATECGELSSVGVADSGYKFCPFCGSNIIAVSAFGG